MRGILVGKVIINEGSYKKYDNLGGVLMKEDNCCGSKKGEGVKQALIYGLVPHIGCIAFLIGSVLGVTVLMNVFKPVLMNRYLFHILILISIGFATLSAVFYLKNKKLLSLQGVKKKKKYLATMYGLTIGINLLLFFVIFPLTANATITGGAVVDSSNLAMLSLEVDIPCPGHAPLISEELKTITGVASIDYGFPDKFDVEYDSSVTGKDEILGLEVFDEYPATILLEQGAVPSLNTGSAPSGGCGGSCGSSCGGGSSGGSTCGGCGQ